MRHALTVVAVAALAAACASPGMPPGGPTISSFPRVIATLPDTNKVNVTPSKVLLRYDDVIGEQFTGGPLSRGVLISPWDGEPRVEWRRTGMTIRPRGSWRANTAYTITVLPGVSDLKNQPSPFGYTLHFSTGPTIPVSVIRGVAFDWVQARPLPRATVQAIDVRDTTLVFLAVADSSGRFELGAVPPGTYMVRAIDEKTTNRALEPREPWDTVRVALTDSARVELYTFVHDTLPVRISEIRSTDSVTISLTFDKPLKPALAYAASAARVISADSVVVAVARIVSADEDRRAQEQADSVARARDTTGARPPAAAGLPRRTIDPTRRADTVTRVPPPVATRPKPATELLIKLLAPLTPGGTYRVTVSGIQNMLGVAGDASRVLVLPRPAPPDSTKRTPADSTQRPPLATPGTRPAVPPVRRDSVPPVAAPVRKP